MRRIRHWLPIHLLLLTLLTSRAYGNGINPPEPQGSQTVDAFCSERTSGKTLVVLRARITIEKPSGSLELRIGESQARLLQLSRVIRLEIPSAVPMSDGFTKALLRLSEPDYEGPGLVRIRAGEKQVRVTGFDTDINKKVDIALETCKDFAVKASIAPEGENRRWTKD